MKRIVLLGSTGSIGTAAVEILEFAGDGLSVEGLVAGRNTDELARQLHRFPNALFAVGDEEAHTRLLGADGSFSVRSAGHGHEAIIELIERTKPDLVVNALVGISGLIPTLRALELGCSVALANKETLVTGGELIAGMSQERSGLIIPVDSEHFSVKRCLEGYRDDTEEIVLTASGGPFYGRRQEELRDVSVDEVLDHPTWNMGRKVTIDSAHLLNKGLEVIEAHWLFGFPYGQIKVVIHPQSVVHAIVRLRDGSLLAHVGPADMRLPLMSALYYPEICAFPWRRLELEELGTLEFFPLDTGRFPAFDLAIEAAGRGGTAPTVVNAADEVAIDAFLHGRIGFLEIIEWIDEALAAHDVAPVRTVEDVLDADQWAREYLLRKHGNMKTT
jgi:1-deoxy-D-xylulose-5-phosphate reductoisomerase